MLEPPEAIVHATLSSLSSGRLGIFGLVQTKILQKKFLYVLHSRNIYRMVISIKMQGITENYIGKMYPIKMLLTPIIFLKILYLGVWRKIKPATIIL